MHLLALSWLTNSVHIYEGSITLIVYVSPVIWYFVYSSMQYDRYYVLHTRTKIVYYFFVSNIIHPFSKSSSCWIDFLFACILGSGDRTIDGIASTKQLWFLICDGNQIILVILWLSVVMIKDRFGKPGSVSLT